MLMQDLLPILVVSFIKIALVIGAIMTGAAYLVLFERWMAAWVQSRRGPNRVGVPLTKIKLFGLGQPLADGLKFIFKEEYTPGHVNKPLYILAPISILASAVAVFAVIPFGSVLPVDLGKIPLVNRLPLDTWGWDRPMEVSLVVAPEFDVGLIYVFALSSVAVYGVILGGWSSNNMYSLLGAMRSSAQLIAYELPLGLGILGVVLCSGSLRMEEIINRQAESGMWFVFLQPLGMVVFVVAAFAEAARLPFDLPEAEQELIGGYHTEYSGMKLMLFLTAEFIHMITASFLIVILFFGGWHFWGLTNSATNISVFQSLLRVAILIAKVLLVICFFMLVRWSWPRFRFDQLMALAWKIMLPLGMVNLFAVAIWEEFGNGQSSLIGVAWGWGVATAAWLITALATPLISDNQPWLEKELEASN